MWLFMACTVWRTSSSDTSSSAVAGVASTESKSSGFTHAIIVSMLPVNQKAFTLDRCKYDGWYGRTAALSAARRAGAPAAREMHTLNRFFHDSL
jgi:hypothetical protein